MKELDGSEDWTSLSSSKTTQIVVPHPPWSTLGGKDTSGNWGGVAQNYVTKW